MNEQIAIVIEAIGRKGGMGNVMEALGYGRERFQEGFDIANEMQNRDLVKLLYSNYNQNNIVVEFTLLAHHEFRRLAGE